MAVRTEKKTRPLPDRAEDVVDTREYHCSSCGRFLLYEAIVWGQVKIKCPDRRCKTWNVINIKPPP